MCSADLALRVARATPTCVSHVICLTEILVVLDQLPGLEWA